MAAEKTILRQSIIKIADAERHTIFLTFSYYARTFLLCGGIINIISIHYDNLFIFPQIHLITYWITFLFPLSSASSERPL
ncbi:hypothetical protein D3C78_1896320 [compost metagenome]